MAEFSLSTPGRIVHAGIILMGGETEILDVAPLDLLHGMSKKFIELLPFPDELKKQALDVEFHWVNEKGGKARLTSHMSLDATESFETAPILDIVLLGAHNPSMHMPNEAELDYIRKVYDECSAFLTICGGFIPAQMAGILVGKTATAPRSMIEQLRKEDPRTNWVEKRWVRDGKVWTSGALLNGLDLMMAFVKDTFGIEGEKAKLIEVALEVGGWPMRDVDY